MTVGLFAFPPVQPGSYEIILEATDMQTWEGKSLLQVGQTAEITPVLRVGAMTNQVTVAGDVSPRVSTSDATLSVNLERARIEGLLEHGRNAARLVLLQYAEFVRRTRRLEQPDSRRAARRGGVVPITRMAR